MDEPAQYMPEGGTAAPETEEKKPALPKEESVPGETKEAADLPKKEDEPDSPKDEPASYQIEGPDPPKVDWFRQIIPPPRDWIRNPLGRPDAYRYFRPSATTRVSLDTGPRELAAAPQTRSQRLIAFFFGFPDRHTGDLQPPPYFHLRWACLFLALLLGWMARVLIGQWLVTEWTVETWDVGRELARVGLAYASLAGAVVYRDGLPVFEKSPRWDARRRQAVQARVTAYLTLGSDLDSLCEMLETHHRHSVDDDDDGDVRLCNRAQATLSSAAVQLDKSTHDATNRWMRAIHRALTDAAAQFEDLAGKSFPPENAGDDGENTGRRNWAETAGIGFRDIGWKQTLLGAAMAGRQHVKAITLVPYACGNGPAEEFAGLMAGHALALGNATGEECRAGRARREGGPGPGVEALALETGRVVSLLQTLSDNLLDRSTAEIGESLRDVLDQAMMLDMDAVDVARAKARACITARELHALGARMAGSGEWYAWFPRHEARTKKRKHGKGDGRESAGAAEVTRTGGGWWGREAHVRFRLLPHPAAVARSLWHVSFAFDKSSATWERDARGLRDEEVRRGCMREWKNGKGLMKYLKGNA